jgi:ABC-type lipoprotein release transport system permease subunit
LLFSYQTRASIKTLQWNELFLKHFSRLRLSRCSLPTALVLIALVLIALIAQLPLRAVTFTLAAKVTKTASQP